MRKARIVIVGSTCVGKTSLVLRYVLGKFNEQHTPTVSDCHEHIAKFPGTVALDSWNGFCDILLLSDRRISCDLVTIILGPILLLLVSLSDRTLLEAVRIVMIEELKREHIFVLTLYLENGHGCHHCIEVLDTAGGDHFPVMRTLDIQRGDVFIIVLSVDSRDALSAAKATRKQIQDIKGCSKVRAVWVGNKIDLVSSRKVTAEEALLNAFTFGDAYIETSAKYNINVNCVFHSVLSLICMEPVTKDWSNPDSKKKVSRFHSNE
ncbi:hypothetical protein CHS0354_031235 [Potamilus streckersoni]|uniref:Uncharacterized protein n=1 Tax=Potamilus streckersoni TaxID=2493646 RepID=A0AAE0SBT1_9BIVA|nr:hypothetical protein CHS0354_031235 [Potamilus streckersoni]